MSDWLPDAADTRSLGSATREWLNVYIGDAGKMYFGLAQDVNLYRSAANILKTDDSLEVAGTALRIATYHLQWLTADCALYKVDAAGSFIFRKGTPTSYTDLATLNNDGKWSCGELQTSGNAMVRKYQPYYLFYAEGMPTDEKVLAMEWHNSVFGIHRLTDAMVWYSTLLSIDKSGVLKAFGGYKSSDGTAGATGTITVASVTSITVKNGLITAWS